MKEIIENPTRHGYTSRVSRLLAKAETSDEQNFPFEAGKTFKSPQILKN
jgi:membrane-bound lytic murein transglycosylase D